LSPEAYSCSHTFDARLFFRPDQAGQGKTAAAVQTLLDINPDVEFEAYNCDITLSENYEEKLLKRIAHGGKDGKAVNLVLSCVDNFEARVAINQVQAIVENVSIY